MKLQKISYHWCSNHFLICIISHLWSGIGSELMPGFSINAPHHITVQRGLCAYIPCQFTVPRMKYLRRYAEGIWYNKDEDTVASSRFKFMFVRYRRFSLVGDVRRGDCSLYIEDPLYEDEGTYHFKVEDDIQSSYKDMRPYVEDNIKFSYQDIRPFLEVTDLTDKPEISPIKSRLDGEEVTLTCTAPGRCKRIKPQITWEGNIQNRKVDNQVTYHTNDTKAYYSTITFTARKEQNNSPLSCIVQLRGGLTTAQQITVKVEYAPRIPQINCFMPPDCPIDKNNNIYVQEGSTLSLQCFAESLPPATIVWLNSQKIINTSPTGQMDIHSISPSDDGLYACQAKNVHGTSRIPLKVKVTSKPKTVSTMKSYCKTTGDHIECTCTVQSFPEATMHWQINDKFYDSSDKDMNISTSISDSVTISTLNLHFPQKDIPYIKCISSNKYGDLVLDLLYKKPSIDYKVIVGIVSGIIILLLIALAVVWQIKRHTRKKQGNNDVYELGDAKETASVYQDLQRPTNSIYHSITRSQQNTKKD